MANFTAGTSFTDGVTNDVTAAKLNALIADAVPTANLSLNSTTGTVSNFTTSTATINGPITASTAVINVGSGQIYKDASGNVGVGDSSPSTRLQVRKDGITGANNFVSLLTSSDSGKGVWQGIDVTNRLFYWKKNDSDDYAYDFQTANGTSRLRIDSSGNVGIGRSSPSFKLDVNGVANATYLRLGENTAVAPSADAAITRPADGTMALITNASERLRIDSSGNVGIGTTSPATKLTISGTSGTGSELRVVSTTANTGGKITFYESTFACWEISAPIGANGPFTVKDIYNNAERLRIDSNGSLLIGTTSSPLPAIKIYTSDGSVNSCYGYKTGSVEYAGTISNHPFSILTNNSERLRIDSSGNVLVGTTNSGQTTGVGLKLKVGDTNVSSVAIVYDTAGNKEAYTLYNANATNNGYRFYVTANGGINNFSANNVNISDERLKTNIKNAGNYLEKICSIPVRTFLYKDQGEDTEKTIGVIAQEVEAVIPELINNDGFGETPEDGIPLKTIYQTDFQYVLMRCIQEQQVIINELKAKVAALEAA